MLVGTAAEAKGKKNLGAMYCAESPVCAQLIPLMQGIGKLFGLKVTPQKISATAPNYTAPCLAMKSAGADALYIADNGPIVARVLASCKQQNYTPLNVGQASTTTNAMLKDPSLTGPWWQAATRTRTTRRSPRSSSSRTRSTSTTRACSPADRFSYDAFYAWTAGTLFEAAAKAAKSHAVLDAGGSEEAFYSLKNETLGGVAPPLNFTPGKPAFTPCWFTGKVAGGTLVSQRRQADVLCRPRRPRRCSRRSVRADIDRNRDADQPS